MICTIGSTSINSPVVSTLFPPKYLRTLRFKPYPHSKSVRFKFHANPRRNSASPAPTFPLHFPESVFSPRWQIFYRCQKRRIFAARSDAETGTISSCYITFLKHTSAYGIAAGYCISASLLSIINKWAVMRFPYPGALTALQYLTSFLGVVICGSLKLVEYERLDLLTMFRFLPAAVIFYISLFTNSELLLHANVDTFIVFRSAVPIFVAIGETLYLHQPWPALKTWLSLGTIFAGSVMYVLTDYQFTLAAYSWALAYLVSMSIDFVYIKHVVMTIGLNTWGLVLYNNLEVLLLFPIELLIMGELKKIEHDISDEYYSFGVVFPVGLSCLFGLAISFFGFSCRRTISATGFTVLGIVNKLLTVVINLVIWDKHSTVVGTVGLLVCMAGGVLYQRSTTSDKTKLASEGKVGQCDDEREKLLVLQSVEVEDSNGVGEKRAIGIDGKS